MLRFKGEYKGMKCRIVIDHMTQTPMLSLYHKSNYRVRIGERPQDTFTRLKHLSNTIVERIAKQKEDIVQTENNLARAKEEQGRPFAHAAEEREKMARLRELDQLMDNSAEEAVAALQIPSQKSLPEKSFSMRVEAIARRERERRGTPQQAVTR